MPARRRSQIMTFHCQRLKSNKRTPCCCFGSTPADHGIPLDKFFKSRMERYNMKRHVCYQNFVDVWLHDPNNVRLKSGSNSKT